jgi:F-type H+-transporting ATPase subunit epsilon
MTIRCEIISQDRLVFEGDADMIVIPGVNGEMGILPNHAPLLSILDIGVIRVRAGSREDVFTVTGGIVDVQPYIVTILADAAENVDEIDTKRAENAKKRAQELLKKSPIPGDADTLRAVEIALKRSNLRLDVVKRYRAGHERIPQEQAGQSKQSGEN